MVDYNVQTVVETEQRMIMAHEVTSTGSDRAQLSKMALAAREAIGVEQLHTLADRSYSRGPESKA